MKTSDYKQAAKKLNEFSLWADYQIDPEFCKLRDEAMKKVNESIWEMVQRYADVSLIKWMWDDATKQKYLPIRNLLSDLK